MKELQNIEKKVYLEEFDVNVNCYLTLAQIQQIVNAMNRFQSWSEREQNKNILILYHTTDIGKEKIEEYDYDTFQNSGLLDAVLSKIENLNKLDEAITYTESIHRTMNQIYKEVMRSVKANNK